MTQVSKPVVRELQDVLDLDRTIHEPARLVILAVLNALESADFTYLMDQTRMTQGNLSAHLSKLETAGYISITKSFEAKRPRTTLRITPAGTAQLIAHARKLSRFITMIGVKPEKTRK
mgnify:CR=1 FL=1